MRGKGSRDARVITADGEIQLSRRYFWAKGKGGTFPADAAVGIDQGRVSPGAREILCRLGMVQDFRQAADDAARIGNVPVGKERLRQLVESEAAAVTQARNSGELKAAWSSADAKVESGANGESLTRVYAGVDGVMAPTVTQQEKDKRRENQAIRRQQRSAGGVGNAKPLAPARAGSDERFKEMKIGLFYDQEKKHRHAFVVWEVAQGACRAGRVRAGRSVHLADRRGQVDRRSDLPDAAADQGDAVGLLPLEPAHA